MKAIVQDAYGPPDVLELRDVPIPSPGDGEVLVRVRAAGVDAGVVHLTTGLPYLLRLAGFGLRAPKVPVRGMDGAGVVEAVGPGVTRFRPGEEVFGVCQGSFAEYALARQDRLAAKPEALTFEQAAALPTSGLTALHGLRDRGRVREGQKVLVIGAGGGVGTFAVQLAGVFGARVAGLCGPGKADLVRSLGAADVFDHTRVDVADLPSRYDLILDIAGNRPLSRLRRALTPRGTLVLMGGEAGGRWTGGMGRQLRAALLSPFTRRRLTSLLSLPREEDLRLLAEIAGSGRVTPVVTGTFPLADAAEAVRRLAAGHASGKIVVTV
ncbi:NAD(P)-dependent alcohol dehydrogenase [Microbispora sp. ATCC PTA-5024]|uniref:NAD(P)-dependent alcohol dehydrogenase n=1 Tax=Microbispora sp. ATCC PTA-5024 TaxID=316330 RepID=UPI0003DD7211|nr:NAD(P)-dependent alcohol dehydrogenase [Microbispora sp. ATCC PTA-5024]ETK36633.1 NADPH:quinone reductase [Microbispora sp. ATCC PTA-5024]